MADTVYTPDGRVHVLLGSISPASIIREYAGDEVADWVGSRLDYMERKEMSDLAAYEADLDHLHRMMRDWVEELQSISILCENTRVRKASIRQKIINLKADIANEL